MLSVPHQIPPAAALKALALATPLCSAFPAASQTLAEAAALNTQLAIELCVRNYRVVEQIRPAFEAAGFVHSTEDFGGGQHIDWYAAPADTVNVAIISTGVDAADCRVTTGHMDVTQALPFSTAVVEALLPGQVQPGSPEGQNILPGTPESEQDFCSGFHVFAPRKLIWVQLARAGNDGTCRSDGTASINIRM